MLNIPKRCVELILEQSGIVAITDNDGRYIFVNKKWQEDTGISEKDAIGKYNHELIEGSRALAAIKSGRVIMTDFFVRKKDGKGLPGIMSYTPIFDEDRIVGCFISKY